MGQKSLNFSVNKCIRAQFNSGLCQVTYQTTQPSCKFVDAERREEPGVHQQRRRYTTEELSRWIQRFTKAKIASRKQHDLRREVLLHNAFIFAQSEVKCRQVERQKRWKELKPLLFLETSSTFGEQEPNKMAAFPKMADGVQQQMETTEEEMDMERPSTPLPSVTGATKRHRCGCLPLTRCECGSEDSSSSSSQANKKFRPSSLDEDDDLKSLDRFLSSLHCNTRQVVDWENIIVYQMCPTD
ncbi:uncharacterized protein LOC124192871 isoform X2 [Daphnia pulex]|uniref:uncharacterized protein LOC124192871 isoform X2 n=1 Tax=Daphnia pulex TaxID=6669 RepID=UPI001EE01A87|nr:uncharacterized protein LOC124192871 isoform X2 [Daphnia pulex]XP_046442352.1 uncharacterized protein LOC124192871 isoform X2 [Daphnia pulex]XP_046442353.1 uncharacterized protein LOC124192871 isoform X2 [Daphnia pulex]